MLIKTLHRSFLNGLLIFTVVKSTFLYSAIPTHYSSCLEKFRSHEPTPTYSAREENLFDAMLVKMSSEYSILFPLTSGKSAKLIVEKSGQRKVIVRSLRGNDTLELIPLYDPLTQTTYLDDPNTKSTVFTLKEVRDELTLEPTEYKGDRWTVDKRSYGIFVANMLIGENSIVSTIGSFLHNLKVLQTDKEVLREQIELIFMEDDQGYTKTPILFRTNYPGDVSQLEKISLADRFSDSFEAFKDRLISLGYTCEPIRKLNQGDPAPEGYPIVKGAIGNY